MEVWVQETRTETQPLHWPPPWESSGRAVECLYSDSISHDEFMSAACSVCYGKKRGRGEICRYLESKKGELCPALRDWVEAQLYV